MECVIGHKIDYIGVGVVRDQWRRPFSNQSEANIYRDLLIRRSLRASSTVRRRVPAYFWGFAFAVVVSLLIPCLSFPKDHLVAFMYLACMPCFILPKGCSVSVQRS